MGSIYFAVFCVLLVFILVETYVYYLRPQQTRLKLNETLQYHPDWKRVKRTERLFNALYRHVRGKAISSVTRRLRGIKSDEFVYGEIEFISFFFILEKIKPQAGEIFYDLGSGTGKAVFAAALGFDFSKACGIELLPALYQKAEAQRLQCKNLLLRQETAFTEVYLKKLATVEFMNASFLEADFSDADIVYVAATCLGEATWGELIEKLAELKIGSRIIVATKTIQHEAFELLESRAELMSWGLCRVNRYQKIA